MSSYMVVARLCAILRCMGRRRAGVLLELELAILREISAGTTHGHALAQATERPPTTIYNAVRRLERNGLLRSRWQAEGAGNPPRRVYRLTAKGRKAIAA